MHHSPKLVPLLDNGIAHYIFPLIMIALIAIVGGYVYLSGSSAATTTTAVYLESGVSGKCLDDHDDSSTNGIRDDSYACNKTASQQWTLNSNGTIENPNGKCLDNAYGKNVNNNPITVYTCSATNTAEQWKNTGNILKNPVTNKCIDIPYGNTKNGTEVILYTCDGLKQQTWTAVKVSTTSTGSGTTGGGGSSSTCTAPAWNTSDAEGTDSIGSADLWWVNNDAWSGSHGPQTIYVCSQSSWYAVTNQPDIGGQVETYPDTEYDVGGRSNPSTKTIAQLNSITSTFSEAYPSAGSWDAAYDLWTNNWTNETMIWNQWAGADSYWPGQATTALTLNGVAYHFLDNGGELMFFRDTQVTSGSADILAAYQWEVAHGYAKSTDVPTQLEYGVEVCSTAGSETFPMTGLTFTVN